MGCGGSTPAAEVSSTPAAKENGKGPAVQVYMLPMSQNACGPAILAMDLGVGSPVQCDLMAGEHKKPEFLKIHPYGQIPAMKNQETGFCLGESSAILRYLALKYPGKNYYPLSDPQKCAKIDFAMDAFSKVYKAHAPIVYQVFGFSGKPDDQNKANEEYTAAINEWFDVHCKDSKFVAGSYPTIADFKAAPFMYSAIQPSMKSVCGFEPPPRAVAYCKDFMAAVKASDFMQNAGGYSMREFAKSKDESNKEEFPLEDCGKTPPTYQENVTKPGDKGMKIHMMPVSQNAVGPVLLAQHIGKGDGVVCDLMTGAHKKPEYLAINPYGMIPALEDGSFSLGESNAILRYLGLSASENLLHLYPAKGDPEKCGKIDFAIDAFSEVYKAHTKIVYKVLGFMDHSDDQAKANQEYTDAINKWFEIHVDSDPKKMFVGGDKPTIADFKAAPFMYSAIQPVMEKKVGFKPPERAVKYCNDFKAAVKESAFMDDGEYSLKNFCQSKE